MMQGGYIPSTLGEVRDRISSMILYLPDIELPNTGLGMAAAYEQLEHSLHLIKPKIGEARYEWLIQMSRQSHGHFVDGSNKAGRSLLAEIQKMIR